MRSQAAAGTWGRKVGHLQLPDLLRVSQCSGRKKAHEHKLFALSNVQMALGQMGGCPRVSRAKKFMCLPRNTGIINFSLWLTGGLSQGCPDFQKFGEGQKGTPGRRRD